MDDGNNAYRGKEMESWMERPQGPYDIERFPVVVSLFAALVVAGIALALFSMGVFSPGMLVGTFIVSFLAVLSVMLAGRIKKGIVAITTFVLIVLLFVLAFLIFWR